MHDFSILFFFFFSFSLDTAVQVLLKRVGPDTQEHFPSALQMRTIKSFTHQLPLPAACLDSTNTIESGNTSSHADRSGPQGQG